MGIGVKLMSLQGHPPPQGGRPRSFNLTPMGEQGLCGSSVGFNSIKHINPFHPSIVILNEVKNLSFNSIKHINPFHLQGFSCISCVYLWAFVAYDKPCQTTARGLMKQ